MELDVASLRKLLAAPGMDTSEWVSYAIVDTDPNPDNRPIEFSQEYGVLVNVTLQPSGVQARARHSSGIAGNGEMEYYPYLPGDEVIVICPMGTPDNCVIVGRLNQEIDAIPTMVAGNDPSTNTFGFRRHVAPYMIETRNTYLILNAINSAAFIMEAGGNVTLRDGLLSALHIGADFIGLQTNDGGMQLQMSLETNTIRLAHNGDPGEPSIIFDMNGQESKLATGGTLALATAGNAAEYHGITLESVLALIIANNAATAAAVTAAGGPAAYLAAAWSAPGVSGLPGSLLADAAMPVANTAIFNSLFLQAINALLSVPKVVASGAPGIGCVGLTLG